MRKIILNALIVSAMTTTALIATPALARDGAAYVGIEGGVTLPSDTTANLTDSSLGIGYNTGFEIGGVVGYDMGFVRIEGDIAYRRAGLDLAGLTTIMGITDETNFDLSSLSFMANGLFSYDTDFFEVYAGPGIGYARHTRSGSGTTDFADSASGSGFAWQIVFGADYFFSEEVSVGVKYRYTQTLGVNEAFDFVAGSSATNADVSGNVGANSITATLRFHFGVGDYY